MSALFESDSEYEWLLLIKTPFSYNLNSTIPVIFAVKKAMEKAVAMTKRLYVVKNLDIAITNGKAGRLEDFLLNAVDETLKQVFTEVGTQAIYDYLENHSHLKREEIAEKPEVFSAGLERLLSSGGPVIEKMILKNLYSKLGLKFEEKKGYEFSDT